jgi:hypothetical protein
MGIQHAAGIAIALVGGALFPAALVQAAAPTTIPEVVALCAPIIAEEYQGKTDRWFQCVQGTQDFVNLVLGPPKQVADTGQVAADLVFQLSTLYRDGASCVEHETELPDAIAVALAFEVDTTQRELIESIAASIKDCQAIETGFIGQGVPASRS